MNSEKFSEQTISKLKKIKVLQANGQSITEICPQPGIMAQTYYRWRKEFVRRTKFTLHLNFYPLILRLKAEVNKTFFINISSSNSSHHISTESSCIAFKVIPFCMVRKILFQIGSQQLLICISGLILPVISFSIGV